MLCEASANFKFKMETHHAKNIAQAEKNATATKSTSGTDNSTSNAESDVSSAHVPDVGQTSSPVRMGAESSVWMCAQG